MIRLILPLLLATVVTVPAAAEWQLSEFMISWWGAPGDDVHAQAAVQCGINTIMCKANQLDMCRGYGFKAMLTGATPELAAQLKDDEVIWGYYVRDEPGNEEQYRECAAKREALHEADPNHPGYINLGGSYARHAQRGYMEIVKPEVLSYDYYQWWWGTAAHFSRLEEYRAAALEAGIPLISWIEASAIEQKKMEGNKYIYHPDNYGRLRQSVFTSLAYGVKGIQWWKGTRFCNVRDGQITPQGQDIAKINAELKVMGPTLIRLQSVDVYHTPPLPSATRQVPDDYWVQPQGEGWVLGVFKDPEDKDYLILANRDPQHTKWAVVQIQRAGAQVDKLNKQTGAWLELPVSQHEGGISVDFIVAPGDGELLRLR